MENTSGLIKQIESEIRDYHEKVVQVGENSNYSQAKLVRRISLFESKIYPTGKFDTQGNYKYWFDIISPRIDSEVKNIDFDTKNVDVYSPLKQDELPCIVTNLKLDEYMRTNGQAEEFNDAIEEGSGWGNVVWKKVKDGYERVDLRNFYVINQTAFSLEQTPFIERHPYSQSDLRAKSGVWENIKEVLEGCKENSYSSTLETQASDTTTPFYEVYERTGEVCLHDLKEAKGEEPDDGDKDIYVLSKVIVAGKKSTSGQVKIEYVLYSDKLMGKINDLYKEYHRGRYKGRWFREGLYELLFDIQVRSNQIGNQISQGLAWASKTFFRADDLKLLQNILTSIKNGDVVRSKDLQQVEVRMQGFDQLIAEWNRLMQMANDIANSREVVQGITPTSGTPLGTTQLMNQNANKLFDFIREKLSIPLSQLFQQWIVPDVIKNIKIEDVVRLSGDSDILNRLYKIIVDEWYIRNLINIGPHTQEVAELLKQKQIDELKKRPQLLMKGLKKVFDGFKPNVSVDISGEGSTLDADLAAIGQFIALESDPQRRTALIELAMRKKGIDVASLPKTIQPAPTQSAISKGQTQPIAV